MRSPAERRRSGRGEKHNLLRHSFQPESISSLLSVGPLSVFPVFSASAHTGSGTFTDCEYLFPEIAPLPSSHRHRVRALRLCCVAHWFVHGYSYWKSKVF